MVGTKHLHAKLKSRGPIFTCGGTLLPCAEQNMIKFTMKLIIMINVVVMIIVIMI